MTMKKASAASCVLLGLLSASCARTMEPEPIKAQVEVDLGGVTFKASRFTDGRSTPYRIYFWDEHITGSSYRLSAEGHVVYFKAGDEVYHDRMEHPDGAIEFAFDAAKNGGGHREKTPIDEGLFSCEDCTADLAAVCAVGLPDFCSNIKRHTLGYAGDYSVEILCSSYETLCFAMQEGCDTLCAAEQEPSELA